MSPTITSQDSLVIPFKKVLISTSADNNTGCSPSPQSDNIMKNHVEPFVDSTRNVTSKIPFFPPEIWFHILQYLPCPDLCSVACVSRCMHITSTDPLLWSSRGSQIRKTKICLEGVEFLHFQRFSRLTSLNLQQVDLSPQQYTRLLTFVSSSTSMKHLSLHFADLYDVLPDLLGQSVVNLHSVDLGKTILNKEQSQAVVTNIAASSSLTNVNLKYVDLASIPSGLLCKAVCSLNTVDLENCQLSTEQSMTLCEGIIHSSVICHLNLMFISLMEVPQEAISGIFTTIHTINLGYTKMVQEQLVPVFEEILKSGTIKEINFLGIDCSLVPSDLFAQAVGHLVQVNLTNTNLTNNQAEAVIKAIKASKTMTKINLQGINLSGVLPSLLAESAGSMESFGLADTQLTKEQLMVFLPAVAKSQSATTPASSEPSSKLLTTPTTLETLPNSSPKNLTPPSTSEKIPLSSSNYVTPLQELSLHRVDLSELPSTIIKETLSRLKYIDIGYTNLKRDQITDLFHSIASSKIVQEISIQGIDMTKTSSDLIGETLAGIQKVTMRDCNLSREQITSLLHWVKHSTSLMQLDMLGIDLTEIPTEVLLELLDHVSRVNISRNRITAQQRKDLEKSRRRSQRC